ncbi:MAG: hypothetical protein ABEH64_11090, partial [Salinirussus sp.]
GVILVGVGLTATVGVDRLEAAQLSQNIEGAERGMLLLESAADELQHSQSTVRSSAVSLERGRLITNASSASSGLTVNVSGVGDSPTRYALGRLTYRMSGGSVALEGGGVFLRTNGGSAVVSANPSIICGPDRAVISLLSLQGPAMNRSFSGGDANVVLRLNRSAVIFPENRTGVGNLSQSTGVNLTVHSEFDDGWRSFLTGPSQEWTHLSGDTYRCSPTSGEVYVRQTVIDIRVRR